MVESDSHPPMFQETSDMHRIRTRRSSSPAMLLALGALVASASAKELPATRLAAQPKASVALKKSGGHRGPRPDLRIVEARADLDAGILTLSGSGFDGDDELMVSLGNELLEVTGYTD